ncbi:MAG: hypothetical protein ACFBSE_14945 [Prochloraceae cyanobacterium]
MAKNNLQDLELNDICVDISDLDAENIRGGGLLSTASVVAGGLVGELIGGAAGRQIAGGFGEFTGKILGETAGRLLGSTVNNPATSK